MECAVDDLLLLPTPTSVERALGARVREARRLRGWTQAELARRSTLGVATVARFEATGQGQVSTLTRLCDALGHLEDLADVLSAPAPATLDELRRRSATHRERSP